MQVEPKRDDDARWIDEILARHWGGVLIVASGGRRVNASTLPALIAGDRQGRAIYEVIAGQAELVTLNALATGQGIGTALVDALVARLATAGIAELRVSMTNDNLDALRFYQRRGFRLIAVHPGAIDDARRVKPSIPLVGRYGIPIRDRIDLVRTIGPG